MKNLFFISTFILLTSNLFSKADAKFGKIDKEILEMSVYENDSSANAVILFDSGRSFFTYSSNDGFQVNFERTLRIKIFNDNSFDWANIEIPLYQSGTTKEKVNGFKGFTYNLVGGKVEKEKISIGDLYEEEVNSNWSLKKATMPNIKAGSVFEVKYTIVSSFLYNLQSWQFQYDIPVLYSEYSVTIPEYYNYKTLLRGYLSYSKSDISDRTESFTISGTTAPGAGGVKEDYSYTISSDSKMYEYAMENIPAFKEEPYMTSSKNYISKLIYELKSIEYPNGQKEYITTSWQEITKEMLESSYFGKQLEKTNFIEDKVLELTQSTDSLEEKMLIIYDFVRNNMKWNGNYSQFTTSTLKEAYQNNSGNTADINLLLTLMLKINDINAKPVVISTRGNGILYPDNPSITSFNYVICVATINGKKYYLDATEKNCPAGLLPKRCLNGNGRIIDSELVNEIEINPDKRSIETSQIQITLDEAGKIQGTINQKFENNVALYFRNNISENQFDEYVKEIESKYSDLKIENFETTNLDDIYSDLKITYNIYINESATVGHDLIYLNPMLGFGVDENPFKLDNRHYPVDYAYPFTEKYLFSLTIPEGYEVDEIPESVIVNLGENSGKFMFSTTQMGKTIQVVSLIDINKSIFTQTEYADLKAFYSNIVSKHSEMIVLKKI